MSNIISRRWGLSSREGKLLIQLLLLAVTILAYSVIAMAIANSLFVNYVGANRLPLAFIAIGLTSIPAYGLFSTAIDSYSRPKLFRFVLLLSGVIAIALRLLLNFDSIAVYYGLLIAVFFQWDFYNNILYPSLAIDYFTAVEYKRYTPFIGIAQAVGTMVGGSITVVLSRYFRTRDLLWVLPLIIAIAFLQIVYLEKSQPKLDLVKPKAKTSLLDSLQSFPKLAEEYPLVWLLAGSSFLLVIIYLSSEFLWFSIYGNSFSEQELTSFLGKMRIIISLVQVGVLYGLTRPLLKFFGVAKLNAVYPVTTLLSFVGLLCNFRLSSAIVLHINGDAFYKGINLPIHQLNYNAIPPEFRGRVRALSDGLIYAVGLTMAGIILGIAHHYLSLGQITAIAGALTVLLLLLRLPMGKYYAQGLEQMICADTIDLDRMASSRISLSLESQETIREMLASRDRYNRVKGLELSSNFGQLREFIPEIKQIIATGDDETKTTLVELLVKDREVETIYQKLLQDSKTITTAWELALNLGYSLPQPTVSLSSGQNTATLTKKYSAILTDSEIEPQTLTVPEQKSLIRAVAWSNRPQTIELLGKILRQDNPELNLPALKALSNFATTNNEQLAQIAIQQLGKISTPLNLQKDREDIELKITAWQIIEKTCCLSALPHLKSALSNPHSQLRQQIAQTLAAYGTVGLEIAQESLKSGDSETEKIAIAAMGKIGTKKAVDLLYDYLTPDFKHLSQTQKWQQQIPTNEPTWQPLLIAIADYQQRQIDRVLYILSCLGRSRTVKTIKQILASKNETDLANALETLTSISQRRFIAPLMPILEQRLQPGKTITQKSPWFVDQGYKILLAALTAPDRWLKSGALMVLATIPDQALTDRDPVVRAIANNLFTANQTTENNLMNRILLLKSVSLLSNLSLDELLAIEQALIPEQVLAKQTIYTEGSWGSHFYIIAEGTVKLTKQVKQQEQEIKQITTGQYFGEIAIFDDAPRWDTAIAISHCTLLKLEKKRFLNLIAQRPHIVLEICRFLSQRLRETDKYLGNNT